MKGLKHSVFGSILLVILAFSVQGQDSTGVFTGTITDSVSAAPLSGATIILSKTRGAPLGPMDTVLTDSLGQYTFTHLATGRNIHRYALSVSKTGYITETVTNLILTAGQTDTVDFLLALAPRPDSSGVVLGTVSDSATGAGILSATVILSAGMVPVDTVLTDAAGLYTFRGLLTGSMTLYRVTAGKTGYLTRSVQSGTLAVGQVDTANLRLPAIPTPDSTGAVTGLVTDSTTGLALVGAVVTLNQNVGGTWTLVNRDTTDASGAYRIGHLATGIQHTYRVSGSKTDYLGRNSATFTLTTGQLDTFNLRLPPVLFGAFTGTVRDSATGSVLAGAMVVVSRGGAGGPAVIIDTVATDAAGVYAVNRVPSGYRYTVAASKADYASRTALSNTVAAGRTDTLNFALPPLDYSGVFVGTVLDSATNQGLAGARVILSRLGNFGGTGTPVDTTVTDVNGDYAFNRVITNARYALAASLAGYAPRTSSIQNITPDDTLTVNLLLPKLDTTRSWVVLGLVTERITTGLVPIAGASITVRDRVGGANVYTAVTDSTGRYSIELPAVTLAYTFTVRKAAFDSLVRNTNVTADSTQQNFTLTRTPNIAESAMAPAALYLSPMTLSGLIRYGLPANSHATIRVFNAAGRLEATLVSGMQSAGGHEVSLNGLSLPSGMYYYQLRTSNATLVKKGVLLR